MSHLVCGKFVFDRHLSLEEQVAFSFEVSARALVDNLSIQLSCNIIQDVVFEILQLERATLNGVEMAYLITGSPLWDTSDELISPYTAAGSLDDYYVKLTFVLQNIQHLAQYALQAQPVAAIIIFFSEGYDVSYQEISTQLHSFTERCLQAFKEEKQVPCLKVMISR